MSLKYTAEHIGFLRKRYKTMSLVNLTDSFNKAFNLDKSKEQVRGTIKRYGLKTGKDARFKKGHKPWNKGLKGVTKPNSGNFKKGDAPVNRLPLGSERICSKDGYILVKIAEKNPYTNHPTRYKAKHIVVWEKHNGKVPSGMILHFKDNDKTNCAIENLFLISRALNLRLNKYGYKDAPDELRPTIMAKAKLEVKMFSIENS